MIPHLTDVTSELLNLSDLERQRRLKTSKWIPYPKAQEIMREMTELMHHPTTHRMPNMLLVGDTNSGKSSILLRFVKGYKPYHRPEDGQYIRPVIYVQAPPEPDERVFYELILTELGISSIKKDRTSVKQQQVIHNMQNLQVKLLIIDEFQHILAGNTSKQRLFLNVLKFLSNELKISFVCAGIRSALNAVRHDEQLANRFEPVVLDCWKMNNEFLRLLASFERLLPLRKPSNLINEKIAYKLLAMSHGYIGELDAILKKAAIVAIEQQTECITLKILNELVYVRRVS